MLATGAFLLVKHLCYCSLQGCRSKPKSFLSQPWYFSTVRYFSRSNTLLERAYCVPGFSEYMKRLSAEKTILESQSLSKPLSADQQKRLLEISPAVSKILKLDALDQEIVELSSLSGSDAGQEMRRLVAEELKQLEHQHAELYGEVLRTIVPDEAADENGIIMEVHAGVGGQEAGIFAAELFSMYREFCNYQGWSLEVSEVIGMEAVASSVAYNRIQATIQGENVFRFLKFESGVHRVQRVPETERSGRMHTSTAVVVILPIPTQIQIEIADKDLKIDCFRAGGKGGQGVNTTESAVRITHVPTGTVVECQQERSQLKNRKLALQILRSRLYERKVTEQQHGQSQQRRLQLGGAGRNEKIRTYNFQQDRVTDHRIKLTVTDIQTFLLGQEKLLCFLHCLIEEARKDRLQELIAAA